jgi:hypothetical protein
MRVLLRLLSPLLGLAVAVLGALLVVEVVGAWLLDGGPAYHGVLVDWPSWRSGVAGLSWQSLPALFGCGAVAVIGVLVLLVATNARQRGIRLDDPSDELSVTASPDVLARLVGQRVRAGEDVLAASVTASGRLVRVRAVGREEDPGRQRPAVRKAVDELLGELPLARRPKVKVSVRAERGLR